MVGDKIGHWHFGVESGAVYEWSLPNRDASDGDSMRNAW